jgi:hypothetical protein
VCFCICGKVATAGFFESADADDFMPTDEAGGVDEEVSNLSSRGGPMVLPPNIPAQGPERAPNPPMPK